MKMRKDLKKDGETITPKAWRAKISELTIQKDLKYQIMKAMR